MIFLQKQSSLTSEKNQGKKNREKKEKKRETRPYLLYIPH